MSEGATDHAFKEDILEYAPTIIALHDADNNIIWANKAYREASGLSLEELNGKKCYFVWGLDKLCKDCPVRKAITTGESAEAEMTPDNQEHWCYRRLQPDPHMPDINETPPFKPVDKSDLFFRLCIPWSILR